MLSPLLGVYSRCDIYFDGGRGATLFASNGQSYIDFASGIAVMSLGYSHPSLNSAMVEAIKLPWHVSNLYQIQGQNDLAQKLVDNSCLDSVFFCNSGAEAVETAIKIIRKNFAAKGSNKHEILTFEHGFHGRTMAAISASGAAKYKEGYAPLLPGFKSVPLANLDISALDKYVTEETAAIMLEPIQGEGGIYEFSPEFLKQVREYSIAKDLILVFDEIQCGMGRTGKLFHHQWYDLEPDILCSAKGIGGGFPLAACLVKEKYTKAMLPGSHGGTYGGNPLAMAAGNAVMDEIMSAGFLEEVIAKGEYLREKLVVLAQKFPQLITEIRGEALMLGLKIEGDYIKLVNSFRDNNVLTVPASNNVIRILPPLVITKKEIDIAIERMLFCLEQYK